MKVLMPRVASFFNVCSKYIKKYAHDPFTNPSEGIPKTYVESLKNTKEIRKKKTQQTRGKGFSKKTSTFVYNELLYPGLEITEGKLFKVDGKNAFKHREKSDVRIGTRDQRFNFPPEVASDFYNLFPDLFSENEEFDLNRHIVVSGCFETNRHTIQAQMECNNFDESPYPEMVHYRKLERAIRDTVRKLQIKEFKGVDITDLREFDFNLDTKPGFRYEHYLLKQKKKECVDEAVFLAEERYVNILKATKEGRYIERGEIIPGIYTIGARNKRETDPEVGTPLVSRAVHMPEFHVELHGGIFSDIITTDFVERGVGPIFIGNSFLKYDRLSKLMDDNYFAIEGDWRKFDSTLCNALITSAVSICRCYFPPGLLYDNHFLAILDSLVIKDYHTVGGDVYRLLHGLPSGSKWTNLIGSIINLIALNFCFSDVKYHERSSACGGDDFLVFFKSEITKVDELCESAKLKAQEIGMEFKFLKKKLYKNSSNIDDYPVFYKYTVFNGVPVTPLESVLERVLSPWNKMYSNTKEVLDFLDDVLPSLAHPAGSCFIYYNFYIFCYYRITGKLLHIEDMIKYHFKMYNKMMTAGAIPRDLESSFDRTYVNLRNIYSYPVKNKTYLKRVFQF